jgi:hypothetical protein
MTYLAAVEGVVRRMRISSWYSVLLIAALLMGGARADSSPDEGGWHAFNGTWTSVGSRQSISLGGDRRASIADYSGSLMLYGSSRPALGFRSTAVVLNDSATGLLGRAVWTDNKGDQIYSELRAAAGPTANQIVGTFIGGSGRYQGATGSYEFSWRFLLQAEDGTVQGQSMDLRGKIQFVTGAGGARP